MTRPTSNSSKKLFLIHGWNMPPLIWTPLLEQLREQFEVQVAILPGYEQASEDLKQHQDYENVLIELLDQAPERSHWCGWSLGATLAMQAAIAAPERISKLTLISPTARFLKTEDWPQGISASVFDQLLRITKKKYAVGLKRFLQMQLPDDDYSDLRNQLAENIINNRPTDLALQCGYETLSNSDLRSQLVEIDTPTQIIAANSDNVISPMASRLCAEQIPNATFQSLGDCHCLPMTEPAELARLLTRFAATTPLEFGDTIDREQVARQFSKAAKTYDSAADLQREMGRTLIDQIEPSTGETLIDLGCGTGDALHTIKTRWPNLRLIGVDIAPAMIEQARDRVPDSTLLVADIEQTGLPDSVANIVISCAAMQWCAPDHAVAEAARLLKPGGQFLMATFVSGTLPEFRKAWRRVRPDLNRVHDLVSEADWRRAFELSNFKIIELTQTRRQQTFESVDELLLQFRKLGASYAGHDRTKLKRGDYENFHQQLKEIAGNPPKLTYQCLTVLAEKPTR